MFRKSDIYILEKIKNDFFYESYAVAYVGDSNRSYFDMRVMRKEKLVDWQLEKTFLKEYAIRSSMRHPYIVNTITVMQDYDTCFFLTELPCGGYLYNYLRKANFFSKNVARFYIAQIILAVQHLHEKRLLYRQLFPENIMIDLRGNVKLKFDFLNMNGLEKEEFDKCIEYLSIDYVRTKTISYESDYYMIGIVLYEMLTGQTPFRGGRPSEVVRNLMKGEIFFKRDIDADTRDLITRFLVPDRATRLGRYASNRLEIRRHPFFDNFDWASLESGTMPAPIQVCVNSLETRELSRTLDDVYVSDYKEGQDDGYGAIFERFRTFGDCPAYTPYGSKDV